MVYIAQIILLIMQALEDIQYENNLSINLITY